MSVGNNRSPRANSEAPSVSYISQRRATSNAVNSPTLCRSNSAPESNSLEEIIVPTSEPAKHPQLSLSTSRSSVRSPAMSTKGQLPRALGKRKRDAVISLVPEKQRIFSGLKFFFFPNNDSNPARRMRITKSLEYGATWIKDWSATVTHVIVDNSIKYDQVLSWLKLEVLPTGVICVNETYPSECISFKMLRDPKQALFKVIGYPNEIEKRTTEKANSQDTSVVSSLRSVLSSKHASEPEESLLVTGSSLVTRTKVPLAILHNPSGSRKLTKLGSLETIPKVHSKPIGLAFGSTEYTIEDAIGEVKTLKHLVGLRTAFFLCSTHCRQPLDLDEEETPSIAESPIEELSGDESDKSATMRTKKRKPWQESFQCMHKHDGKSTTENPNQRTIEILDQMNRYYDQGHDQWRAIAYRKAIATLRQCDRKISTKEEALALPRVGERLAAKIEEIVCTDRLQRLENAKAELSEQTMHLFLGVYGVGAAQASKWVGRGFKTLDDLLSNVKLTENQKIGINHYQDFNSRIPRTEVEEHGRVVRISLQEIDPNFEAIIMGSYRRGAKDSGDIDIIITKPGEKIEFIRDIVCDTLVPRLISQGFLKCTLASTHRQDGSKWHGASCLPESDVWRRIDLLLVPWDELGAALIYFTGNDIFNRSMRLLASRKGMRLNQRGLFREVLRGQGRVKITEGELVEAHDEKKIFAALGVPWRPPEHRIC